jgi:hypothetical protein
MIWFLRKKYKGNTFSDEDRLKAAEVRAANAEIRRLQQEQRRLRELMEVEKLTYELKAVKSEYENGDDDFDLMSLFMPMIKDKVAGMLQSKFNNSPHFSAPAPAQDYGAVSYSKEQIKQFISQIPKEQLKALKSMKHEDIMSEIDKSYNVSEDTKLRIMEVIQEW